MKIHVGNLSDEISEDDIRQAFEKSGAVESVLITKSKYNGQSKTFAFVVMNSVEEGKSAIDSLDGKELKGGSILKVGEALSETDGKGGPGGKGGFGGKKGHGGAKGRFGGSKGFNSGKGGFGGKKSFGGGRGGRGR